MRNTDAQFSDKYCICDQLSARTCRMMLPKSVLVLLERLQKEDFTPKVADAIYQKSFYKNTVKVIQ